MIKASYRQSNLYNRTPITTSPLSQQLRIYPPNFPLPHLLTNESKSNQSNATQQSARRDNARASDLGRDRLVVHDGLGRALLVVEVVGQLRVVLDVRGADLGVVAVEDARDFLERGAPVNNPLAISSSPSSFEG